MLRNNALKQGLSYMFGKSSFDRIGDDIYSSPWQLEFKKIPGFDLPAHTGNATRIVIHPCGQGYEIGMESSFIIEENLHHDFYGERSYISLDQVTSLSDAEEKAADFYNRIRSEENRPDLLSYPIDPVGSFTPPSHP